MSFFNFKNETLPKRNYENHGSDDIGNSWPFSPELILEKKENLPKLLYRGVKNKGMIKNIESATESLGKINDGEHSLINWQTESLSTTEDKNIAFSYALEGETANMLDVYDKSGARVFEFMKQNMGRWLLDHYPERIVDINEKGEVKIDWEKAKTVALNILKEQTDLSKMHLSQNKTNLENIIKKYGIDDSQVKIWQKLVDDGEKETSDLKIQECTELINSMSDESIQFRVNGEIKDVCLGYLFELEPKAEVRVATRESVENFMKHHNIGQVIKPGIAQKGSSKELLTNLMKDAGYHGIDKNSDEKEVGFFNPEDLKPLWGLEVKIVNGKLSIEKHILNNQNA